MSHEDFNHIIEKLNVLSPEQIRRLRRELDDKLASEVRPAAGPTQPDDVDAIPDPLLGIWQDYAEEMDEIVADAMKRRGQEPWRAFEGE